MTDNERIVALAAQVSGLMLAVQALLETHPNPTAALAALDRGVASATAARAASQHGATPMPAPISISISAWRTCLEVAAKAR